MNPNRRRLLTLVGATMLALLLAEVGLRWAGLPVIQRPRTNEFSSGLEFYSVPGKSPLAMHRIRPNSEYLQVYSSNPRGTFDERNANRIRVNARGFRGPLCTERDGVEALRIAFLGDSFTLGEGVGPNATFPARSAALLSEGLVPSGGSARAFNFGMLAFNTQQEEILLHQDVLPCEPDLVVLGFFLNDAAAPYFRLDPASGAVTQASDDPLGLGPGGAPPQFLASTHLGQALWSLADGRSRRRLTIEHYRDLFAPQAPAWQLNREALVRIVRACEERQLPLVVVCFPVLMQLDASYPFAEVHARVGELVRSAAGEHTTFLDLLPSFRGHAAERLWVHPSDHHPNELALDLAARALVEHLSSLPRASSLGR